MTVRLGRAAVGVLLATALLAGCAGNPVYDPAAAERLQQQVLAVSTASAESDWATASTRLLELEASAATALARGEITQERYDAIMAALALVRADVDAAIAAEQAATEDDEEDEDSKDDEGSGGDKPDKPGKPDKDD